MFKTTSSAALLLAASLCLVSCAGSSAAAPETETLPVLHIGSAIDAPYFYMGEDGRYTGIDKEIADEACRRLGWTPEYTVFTWGVQDDLLADGTVDCIWDSFAMNGREDAYLWAGPYLTTPEQILVAVDSGIYTLDDLGGKTIAARIESKGEDYFLTEGGSAVLGAPGSVLATFDSMSEAFAYLGKGYADAVVGHELALQAMAVQAPELYRCLDEPLMELQLGVAFDKSHDTAQITALNDTLDAMREDGTIAAIVQTYQTDSGKAGATGGAY